MTGVNVDKLPATIVATGTGVALRTIQRWVIEKRIVGEMRHGVLYVDPIAVTDTEDQRLSSGRMPLLPRKRPAGGYGALMDAINRKPRHAVLDVPGS
jgi:hypothetical protein